MESHVHRWSSLYVICARMQFQLDRKSTRLNSSHSSISYAVFCLKKKKKKKKKKKNKKKKIYNNTKKNTNKKNINKRNCKNKNHCRINRSKYLLQETRCRISHEIC